MNKQQKTKVDEFREAMKKKHETPEAPKPKAEIEPEDKVKESSGDDISNQIRVAEEEAKGHYDKLLRVMAEFENFKKRMVKEKEEQFKYANEKILTDMLPSLDDMDRVLDHVAPDAENDVKQIAEGVELVRKSLLATLEKFGLKEVGAIGENFDPTMHEAIAVIESEAHEPGKVMSVHRKGYWLGDRLLRPAMVTVAKERVQ